MKKEQISFLSHSISPFFCLIWFLSSHLSFPSPLFIYTLQSLPIAFLIFSFIFPFFLCPLPSTVILSHRFSTCSSFMYFLVPFYLHSLSSPYHTSVLLFFLPDFSLFISFTFLSSFLSTPSSHFFIPCPTFILLSFSPFFTLLQRTWWMQRLLNGRNNEIKWNRNPPRTKHIFSFSSSKSYEFFMFQSSSLMK